MTKKSNLTATTAMPGKPSSKTRAAKKTVHAPAVHQVSVNSPLDTVLELVPGTGMSDGELEVALDKLLARWDQACAEAGLRRHQYPEGVQTHGGIDVGDNQAAVDRAWALKKLYARALAAQLGCELADYPPADFSDELRSGLA
jgi:hypothetical protein